MKNQPKISIITPSFNQSRYIERTIKSVINQNYPNLEYIVIDGGSTDGTVDILKNYSRETKWISEKDEGQSDALNKGFQIVSGDILAFINSDDYYLPGVFDEIAAIFSKNPDIKWITGDYIIVNQLNRPIQQFVVFYKKMLRKFSSMNVLKLTNYIVQPSTFWRREIHHEIGDFDISFKYTFDYDFWMRLMSLYPPFCIDKTVSAFRIHSESKGGKEYREQFAEELKVLEKHNSDKLTYYLHKFLNRAIIALYNSIK